MFAAAYVDAKIKIRNRIEWDIGTTPGEHAGRSPESRDVSEGGRCAGQESVWMDRGRAEHNTCTQYVCYIISYRKARLHLQGAAHPDGGGLLGGWPSWAPGGAKGRGAAGRASCAPIVSLGQIGVVSPRSKEGPLHSGCASARTLREKRILQELVGEALDTRAPDDEDRRLRSAQGCVGRSTCTDEHVRRYFNVESHL